jgi:hypothetical protein
LFRKTCPKTNTKQYALISTVWIAEDKTKVPGIQDVKEQDKPQVRLAVWLNVNIGER